MEASLRPQGRGGCAADDRGLETGEVTISWFGSCLGGQSGTQDGRVSNGNFRNGRHGNSQRAGGWEGVWVPELGLRPPGAMGKGGKLSLLDIQGLAVTRGLKLVELWRSN